MIAILHTGVRSLRSLAAFLLVLSPISAKAVEAPVGDTAVKLQETPEQVRELAICLWEKNRDAALRLSSQEMDQWKNAPPRQFRLRPTDVVECGGQPKLAYMLQNIDALAANLHLIRINQAARCVVKNQSVRVFELFDKLLLDNKARFTGRFANLGTKAKLQTALSTGVHLPQELLIATAGCDAEVGAWADLDGFSRPLFADELNYEAKRNA